MQIKVKIGTQVEGDLSKIIFEPIEQGAQRARRRIKAEMGGAMADTRTQSRADAEQQKRLTREVVSVVRQANREKASEERRQSQAQASEHKRNVREALSVVRQANREKAADERRHAQELAREERRELRDRAGQTRSFMRQHFAEQRQMARENASVGRGVAGLAGSSVNAAGGIVRRGFGVAADFARGAGVNFDTSSMVRDYVSRERMAIDLSNSAYQAGGKGAAGIRQSPAALMQEASKIAQETALDPTKIIEGMQKFTAKTGDLQGARDTIKELAILSQATGTDITNMVDAAGDAFANLGDEFKTGEDKARAVVDVMKAMSGQGKLGAIEIKDMAVQMAGLAAVAGTFQGNRAENMAMLGAMAQEARQRGGAKSAAQAVGSVQSFMALFGKKARLKELQAKGVNVFADAGQTQVLNPQAIITSALSKTRGSIPALNKLFMDVQAQRAVRGFQSVYTEEYKRAKSVKGTTDAQADKAAVAAVNNEFSRLTGAVMKEEEIRESAAAKLESAEAKAQKFQNQLQAIADTTAQRVLPALEKLGPDVVNVADKLGGLASWAASNKGMALGGAVGLGVAKTVVETGVSKAIEAGVGKAVASGLGSALGAGGLAITAAAVTLYAMHELNQVDKEKKKVAGESLDDTLASANKIAGLLGMERGKEQNAQFAIDAEMAKPESERDQAKIAAAQKQKKVAQEAQEMLQQQGADLFRQLSNDMDNAENVSGVRKNDRNIIPGIDGLGISSWMTSIAKGLGVDTGNAVDRRDVANADATSKKMDDVKSAIDALNKAISGGIKITEMPAMPAALSTSGAVTGPGQ